MNTYGHSFVYPKREGKRTMNFEETEVLYNVYRGILRNNRSFQPGKSTAVEYRMDCPEYADLLKSIPLRKLQEKARTCSGQFGC